MWKLVFAGHARFVIKLHEKDREYVKIRAKEYYRSLQDCSSALVA